MNLRILGQLWPLWVLPGGTILAAELRRRRRAGPVLLDLGAPEERVQMGLLSTRNSRQIFGGLMLLLGLLGTLSKSRLEGLIFVAWGSVSVAAVAIPRSFQLREAGILGGQKLFRWQDIQDYFVSPEGGLNLKLAGEWVGSVGNIPTPHRQQAVSLITAKVPGHASPVE